MAGLVGNTRTIANLRKLISTLPKVLEQRAAAASVDAINAESMRTFDAGEMPSTMAWPESDVTGKPVHLVRRGELRRLIKYRATGTIIACDASVLRYAKYQIGKRPVFPRRGAVLPAAWREALDRAIKPIIREHVIATMERP